MNPASEISEELWAFVRRSYESEAWANAILDAIHHFGDVLRLKSGLQSDGTSLAGQALGGKEPKIKINRLATESDRNIQMGVEQLARGLYQGVRNPRSHERFVDSKMDCDAILLFVDFLLRIIGNSKDAFSIETIVERVSDEDFVQNKRYSDLLVNEIPQNKRLEALIAVFENVEYRVLSKRKAFFQVCLESLSAADVQQLFEVVSSRLRMSSDDNELQMIFELLEPHQWLLISEAVRLRSENRVIKSAQAGIYILSTNRCEGGALATWATSFLGHFSLKKELLQSLHSLLSSSAVKNQDYVFRFFFIHFPELSEKPPVGLVRHIKSKLAGGDERYKNAVDALDFLGGMEWVYPFVEDVKSFSARQQPPVIDDFVDDIPF